MDDNEDWRRQRAEALRLHESGPWQTRPARPVQRAVDGVEAMSRPVAAESGAPGYARPTASQIEPTDRDRRLPAAISSPAARTIPPIVPHSPGRASFAARHPLMLGAGLTGALATAGAIGWLLRAEIQPVPSARPAVAYQPLSERPVASTAPAAVALAPPKSSDVTAPVIASPDAYPARPAATPAVAPGKATAPQDTAGSSATGMAVSGSPPAPVVRVAAARHQHVRSVIAGKAARAPALAPPASSRFAHPAKAVALPGRNFGPSFNCRRAVAAVNRAICASPALSSLDRQVSQRFYSVTAHVDLERHKAIDRDQTDFLNQRARCNSDDCVASVYRQRLDALRQGAPGE